MNTFPRCWTRQATVTFIHLWENDRKRRAINALLSCATYVYMYWQTIFWRLLSGRIYQSYLSWSLGCLCSHYKLTAPGSQWKVRPPLLGVPGSFVLFHIRVQLFGLVSLDIFEQKGKRPLVLDQQLQSIHVYFRTDICWHFNKNISWCFGRKAIGVVERVQTEFI